MPEPCRPHAWATPEPEDVALHCHACGRTLAKYDTPQNVRSAVLNSVRKHRPDDYGEFFAFFTTPTPEEARPASAPLPKATRHAPPSTGPRPDFTRRRRPVSEL